MSSKIAAVICTYNRYEVLVKAIESLLQQTLAPNEYEIWVIDNTPDADEPGSEGQKMADKYKDIANLNYVFEKTPGLSNARNVAIRSTSTAYISYLDDDAIASPQWLEEIINGFESFENVGVVGGKIDPIWEIPRPPWLGDNLVGNVSVVDWGGSLRIAQEGEWFAGANISFSRKVLEESGGFSTNLGRKGSGLVLLSNEENEILDFIKSSEYQQVYNPEASVDHLVEEKRLTQSWFRRRSAWQAASDFMLNPENATKNIPGYLSLIQDYLASLPPIQRNIQGLYYKAEDPGQFTWQLSAIYASTVLTLSGYEGLENAN